MVKEQFYFIFFFHIAKPFCLSKKYTSTVKILWKSIGKVQESMLFPKGSPLLPFFNNAYNKLRQTGTLQRIKEKWLNKDKLVKCKSNPLDRISFYKIVSVFALLSFGASCAAVILGLEIIYKMRNSKYSTNLCLQRNPVTIYPEKQFDLQIR